MLSPTLQAFLDQIRGQALGDSNLITNLALFKAAITEISIQTGVSVDWQDDGAAILASGTANFTGAGVVVTNVGGIATIAIAGALPPFGGIDYEEEGGAVVTALTLNAVGVGGTMSDVGGVATLTIPGTIPYQEEGGAVVTARTLNVVGAGATLSDIGGVATLTIPGGGAGVEVQEESVQVVAAATVLNFTGPRITATDVGGVGTLTVPAELPTFHATQQEAIDVAGGSTSVNTHNLRDINTIQKNTITGATLIAGVISLPAGDYHIEAWQVGFRVGQFSSRLRDTTAPATLIVGASLFQGGGDGSSLTFIDGYFTLGVTTNVELQMFTQLAVATSGMGNIVAADGEVEIYAMIKIVKLD